MTLSDVTCLIPLYRSARLLPVVMDNIDSHVALGGRVLCSDEHGLDDAAAQIRDRYAGTGLVQVLDAKATGGNWVSNCNRMIRACQTPFFRIIPHDDSVAGAATAVLAETLRSRPEVVVSHGWVRAQTEAGNRLPQRDEPRLPLRPIDDPMAFSAGLFWQGLFSGSFKSVIRREVIGAGPLLIRPTRSLRHSERAWLFGLSLLGDFAFCEDAAMVKRYWKGSVSDHWRPGASDQIDMADCMAGYVDDLVTDPDSARALRFNLYLNAVRRANWHDDILPDRPPFEPPLPPLTPR
ncbi:hypothetical protein [Tropicibacter oceani]|uniref:Glycosyltransferase n=1 Tax=Tropicibacter oceani TaxID=3058420 RepID=A0ABY8QFG5_9RHOB|nr:hypothetical protein [Tropicibacter oceani]WGW03330.1 hypothetical protein QF118_15570 [Tropicibacter oceani]